eukprot:gene5253-10509_t
MFIGPLIPQMESHAVHNQLYIKTSANHLLFPGSLSSENCEENAINTEQDKTWRQLHISNIEVYNERVRDLLHIQNNTNNCNININSNHNSKLKVREHPIHGPFVEGAIVQEVFNYEDIYNLVEIGRKNRKVASMEMNEYSSRGHSIFTITLTQRKYLDDPTSTSSSTSASYTIVSKMNLVDLAGSESISHQYNVSKTTMKESCHINKSLFTLGRVITALTQIQSQQSQTQSQQSQTQSQQSQTQSHQQTLSHLQSPVPSQSRQSRIDSLSSSILSPPPAHRYNRSPLRKPSRSLPSSASKVRTMPTTSSTSTIISSASKGMNTISRVISPIPMNSTSNSINSIDDDTSSVTSNNSTNTNTTTSTHDRCPVSVSVPYRDSVLTYLLRDSLGGNARTAIVATVHPGVSHTDETLHTLDFAAKARRIQNRVEVNEDPLIRIIKELRNEVQSLRLQLLSSTASRCTNNNTIISPEELIPISLTSTASKQSTDTNTDNEDFLINSNAFSLSPLLLEGQLVVPDYYDHRPDIHLYLGSISILRQIQQDDNDDYDIGNDNNDNNEIHTVCDIILSSSPPPPLLLQGSQLAVIGKELNDRDNHSDSDREWDIANGRRVMIDKNKKDEEEVVTTSVESTVINVNFNHNHNSNIHCDSDSTIDMLTKNLVRSVNSNEKQDISIPSSIPLSMSMSIPLSMSMSMSMSVVNQSSSSSSFSMQEKIEKTRQDRQLHQSQKQHRYGHRHGHGHVRPSYSSELSLLRSLRCSMDSSRYIDNDHDELLLLLSVDKDCDKVGDCEIDIDIDIDREKNRLAVSEIDSSEMDNSETRIFCRPKEDKIPPSDMPIVADNDNDNNTNTTDTDIIMTMTSDKVIDDVLPSLVTDKDHNNNENHDSRSSYNTNKENDYKGINIDVDVYGFVTDDHNEDNTDKRQRDDNHNDVSMLSLNTADCSVDSSSDTDIDIDIDIDR